MRYGMSLVDAHRNGDCDSRTCPLCEMEDVCGETYDHNLRLIGEGDGEATYECRECGAEVFEEVDE